MVEFCYIAGIVSVVLFFIAYGIGYEVERRNAVLHRKSLTAATYVLIFFVIFFAVTAVMWTFAGIIIDVKATNKLRAADDLYKTIHSGLSEQPDIDNARLTVLLNDIQTDLYRRGTKSIYYKYIDNYPWLGLKV